MNRNLGLAFAIILWSQVISFAQSGSLDDSFGNQGLVTFLPEQTLNKGYGIAVQADQKILLAGYALNGTSNEFVLLRILPDGALDPDFGIDGMVKTTVGTDALCYAIALQPDGKILLAGATSTASNGSKDFALLRYLPAGTLDSSFSADGIQALSFGIGDDIARAVLVQPDGNILIAGTSTNGNNALMAIARFQPDGSPDLSFSTDGKNTLGIGTIFSNAYAMALRSDGKILLSGSAKFGMSDDVALAQFNANGMLDTGFGNSGYTVTNLGSDADSGNALAVQPDGKILVAGITGDQRDFALMRYGTNGTLDLNFGNQGKVFSDFAGSDDYANSIIVQPDGKIMLGGYAYIGALPDFALIRYLPDGTPDPDFGINGQVTIDIDQGYDYGFPMTLQADGKLIQAGYSFSNGHTALAIARIISGLQVGVLDYTAPFTGFIAPNPVGQSAVFEFETRQSGSYSLSLTDLEGRVLQQFFNNKVLKTGKQSETLIFTSGLPQGWYCLNLEGHGHIWAIKILK